MINFFPLILFVQVIYMIEIILLVILEGDLSTYYVTGIKMKGCRPCISQSL